MLRAMTPPSSLRGCPSCGMSPKRYSLPQITLILTRKVSKNLDMSHKIIIFSLYKITTTIMSNITVAVNMKIVLYVLKGVILPLRVLRLSRVHQ